MTFFLKKITVVKYPDANHRAERTGFLSKSGQVAAVSQPIQGVYLEVKHPGPSPEVPGLCKPHYCAAGAALPRSGNGNSFRQPQRLKPSAVDIVQEHIKGFAHSFLWYGGSSDCTADSASSLTVFLGMKGW